MSQIEHADFTPSAPNFKHLTFMNMQQLTNFPYIEKDFDALTDYGLLCKVVDYLNEVTANNNEQNSLMVALRDAYIELQNYVNDYFDDLDVQEEINNKLENMAESGELTALIKAYIDPIYEAYEEEINDEISTQNIKIRNIENQVNNLASGSPLVASSTAGMTDTSRVYVNTTDGKWYYYDGDSWEIGGTYQSTGIGDNEVVYGNLSENLQDLFSIKLNNLNFTTGHYIRYDGRYSESNSYKVSDAFLLKKGESIYCKALVSTNHAVISEYYNNAYYPLVIGIPEPTALEQLEYKYTAEHDMYIVLTLRTTDTDYYKYISNIELGKLENIINYVPYYINNEGHYINTSGNYSNVSVYTLTSPIKLKNGEKIEVKSLSATTVSAIAKVNDNSTYESLVVGTSDTELEDYEYTNTTGNDISVVISFNNTKPIYINKVLNKNIFTELFKDVDELQNNMMEDNNYLMAFDNITAIGDSLTFSQVWTGQSTNRQSYNPYPKVLSRLLGCTYDILASSGATPKSWVSSFYSQLTNTNKDNLFIIYLGTNSGLTDTLSTDAPVNTPYDRWANTDTGQYARIVAKCLDLGGRVLLIKPWKVVYTASLETTNNVIDQIASRFNCVAIGPILLENINYHYWPNKEGQNTLHMNDLGYAIFAEKILENIKKLTDTQIYNLIVK